MNSDIKKICIFGGALFAAGVANAQELIIIDQGPQGNITRAYTNLDHGGGSYSYAFATSSGGVISDTFISSPLGSDYGENFMSTTASTSLFRTEGGWLGGNSPGAAGAVYGFFEINFQVSQDAVLLLDWDVSHSNGNITPQLYNATNGFDLIYENSPNNGGTFVGSHSMSLLAGEDYFLSLSYYETGSGDLAAFTSLGTNFMQATLIPSPGAMSLLGIAGIAATRRRRA